MWKSKVLFGVAVSICTSSIWAGIDMLGVQSIPAGAGVITGGIVLSIIFLLWGLRQQKKEAEEKHRINPWKIYDNLEKAFRDLMFARDEKRRARIFARIDKARGRLSDDKLDEIMNRYIQYDAQCAEFDVNPFDDTSQQFFSTFLETMRYHFRKKYGERRNE